MSLQCPGRDGVACPGWYPVSRFIVGVFGRVWRGLQVSSVARPATNSTKLNRCIWCSGKVPRQLSYLPLPADYLKPFALSGARQANIEADKLQLHGLVIGRDQRRCQLQAVGSAQGMSAKQAFGGSTD